MIKDEEILIIGYVRKTHGTKGEVAVLLEKDLLDDYQSDCWILQLNGINVPFYCNDYRYQNNETVLAQFDDITTEQQAQALCGAKVALLLKNISEEADTTEWSSFIGYKIIDKNNGSIGEIADIDTSTANCLFILNNDTIIPAHEDFVTNIDTEKRIIFTALPDGLL